MENQTKLYGKVIVKAKDILDFISQSPEFPTLNDISKNLNITKPTILKILNTLIYCGFITKSPDDNRYHLGIKFLEYASNVTDNLEIKSVTKPFLSKLRDITGETVNLGIVENKKVVLLDKIESPNSIKLVSKIGGTMNMYSSSMGKAILSVYPEEKFEAYLNTTKFERLTENTITDPVKLKENIILTKNQGYALEKSENQKDIICVGFPIAKNGIILGAFSISAPQYRVDDEKLEEFINYGKETQLQILASL
ncbi:IclR family transcriptional regulator [Ligilactobacillus salivarius]|uniref:IclR family transcriptional regulator n=1 Tax=Ligilactobacillus salivarius TaxID=1624 RepID=UPI002672E1FD|nr:IclR family transcriptional regulator [Ligilactobacillus salivarius]